MDVSPMRCLIRGSFSPQPGKWAYPFFYRTARNRFWKILADLPGEPLKWMKADKTRAGEERYEMINQLEYKI